MYPNPMQINVRALRHDYPQRKGAPLRAIQNIDLDIQVGEFVTLIGPSGCGKSTLLRILSGLLEPTGGTVLLSDQPPQKLVAAKRIGWLAQNPALLPWKTVSENIALAQQINPQNHRPLLSPGDLLTLVGLIDFAEAYPFSLSGGMQQRVALARTLALGADLWLMDEPFAALDELTRDALIKDVLALRETQAASRKLQATSDTSAHSSLPTVLWVTHHIYEAARLADRVLVMTPRPGQIAAEVRVNLPRPRDESQPEFQAIVTKLRAQLQAKIYQPHTA
jgi:NitT/TauT family transport system ATP-binding protein